MIKTQQIEICRAKQKDMPYIKEKIQKYVLDADSSDFRQFFVVKNNAITVAFGRIIDHGEYFELASLGVDYYHRKKGFGTKLLRFLIEQARNMNSQKPIYGVTHRPEFLRNSGFEEINIYPKALSYKKNYMCKLDESRIKIMQQTKTF